MCIKNDNHMMHDSWDTKCDRQNFLSFWAIFYPFIPPNNPKSQNFEKIIKKKHGDIIILHKWTINDNHKMYGSLRFKARQTEFFVILGHFLPFNLTNNPKKQNFQKMKKNIWRYLHFTRVPKIMIRWCTIPVIWRATDEQKKWHTEVGAQLK